MTSWTNRGSCWTVSTRTCCNWTDWVRALEEDHSERCDEDLMNDMFRSAHSLKGLSAMLGLADINDLTHKVENVFDAARKDELIISGDCVELMFQAVDRLVAMVDALKDPDGDAVGCNEVIQGISSLLQNAGVERKKSSQADAEKALADLTPEGRGCGPTGRALRATRGNRRLGNGCGHAGGNTGGRGSGNRGLHGGGC